MPNCNFYAVNSDFKDILDFIFSDLDCRLFESYSKPDSELIEFQNTNDVMEYFDLDNFSSNTNKLASIVIWPLKASESVKVIRIDLNPDKCSGATYRYRIDGWGLIVFDLKSINTAGLQYSNTNHNSEKRALAWESNYSDTMGSPSEWDWKVVSSTSRKLVNFIKKIPIKKVGPMPVMPCAASITLAGVVAV